MTGQDLADKLRSMYLDAPEGEMVCMIHLFGIEFADQIAKSGLTPKDLAKYAGINETYATEISKGMRLARYVEIKK